MGQTLYYLESDIFETMTLTANKEYYKNLLMKKLTAFSAELRSTIDGMTDVSEKNPDLSDMATCFKLARTGEPNGGGNSCGAGEN